MEWNVAIQSHIWEGRSRGRVERSEIKAIWQNSFKSLRLPSLSQDRGERVKVQ